MLYEEKLAKVVFKLKEERKITRKGHKTKVRFDDRSFSRVRINDTCKILLQLQDDEKVLKIIDALQPIETVKTEQIIKPSNEDDYEFVEEITVEYGIEFDKWYENYLLKQKNNIQNFDYITLLRLYDLTLDINEQLQLSSNTTVQFPLMATVLRFRHLFPIDTIEMRDEYCVNRIKSLKYLKDKNIIAEYKHGQDGWHTTVTITVNLSGFEGFFQKLKAEYKQRNNPERKKEEEPKIVSPQKPQSKANWSDDFQWDKNSFVFGKYGKVSFTSNDRIHILKVLTSKKGNWATISELKGNKGADYLRSTIGQIEKLLPKEVKKYISIPSTTDDNLGNKPSEGAYRIKFILKP
jgi:hypothetical protein